jgi:hypothetical protein
MNNWVFGLCPLSAILKKTREHNILEIGFASILKWESLEKYPEFGSLIRTFVKMENITLEESGSVCFSL